MREMELETALIDSAGHQNIGSDNKLIRLNVTNTHLEGWSGHISTEIKSGGVQAP